MHAGGVFPHRERPFLVQELVAGLDAVVIETGLGLAHSSQEQLERRVDGEIDQCSFDDVGERRICTKRDPLEHAGDRRRTVDADRRRLERVGHMRMLRCQPLSAEGLPFGGGGADGDESRSVGTGPAEGCRNQPRRVLEPLRFGEP